MISGKEAQICSKLSGYIIYGGQRVVYLLHHVYLIYIHVCMQCIVHYIHIHSWLHCTFIYIIYIYILSLHLPNHGCGKSGELTRPILPAPFSPCSPSGVLKFRVAGVPRTLCDPPQPEPGLERDGRFYSPVLDGDFLAHQEYWDHTRQFLHSTIRFY